MLRALALLIPLAAACAVDLDATSIETQAAKCTPHKCGLNSSFIGILPFNELHPDPNETTPEGLKVVSFKTSKGIPMNLVVHRSELKGRIPGGYVVGDDLVGSILVVQHEPTELQYEVSILELGQFPYFENGEGKMPTYRLGFRASGETGGFRKTCNNPFLTDGIHQFSVFFTGDRYDTNIGEVTAIGADALPWINIACVGDVKQKVLMIRHAEAALAPGFETSQDQRTAAVRMFRADYCGDGRPYTLPNTPLDWENVGGDNGPWNVLNVDLASANIEAIWDETGAICLRKMRHPELGPVKCKQTGFGWATGVPECTDYQINHWREIGGAFITALP